MKLITPFRGKVPLVIEQPSSTIVLCGHGFQLTRRCLCKPDVILQYRQMVRRKSHHLFIHPDGSYTIDHYDDFNPDMGSPLMHLLYDLLPYKLGKS